MQEQIILTGSCYWCLEAIFKLVRGVINVESGLYNIEDYAFSFDKNDKLEAIRLTYEPTILPLDTLLDIFYLTHNPTTVKWDKEDCFYPPVRSSIICFTDIQKEVSENKITYLKSIKKYEDEIQTKIAKIIPDNFFLAEEKYRDYFTKNPTDGYCTSIVLPKIEQLKTHFTKYIMSF
jgi:peptide-methionine (S)-S-oxide reductase